MPLVCHYTFYIYADITSHDMESLMQRIEWTTLLFFASMFITMECLARLGLISWIGQQTESLILCVDDRNAQLAMAILMVLWVRFDEWMSSLSLAKFVNF